MRVGYPVAVNDVHVFWDEVYRTKDATSVSWFQDSPLTSLQLITEHAERDAAISDIGAGASRLIPSLADLGYRALTALDVSDEALALVRENVATEVTFTVADVTTWQPPSQYDLWHDRAVFHFMTSDGDRVAYLARLDEALRLGGLLVIGVFAEDGPTQCSGLTVQRYSADELTATLGPRFEVLTTEREVHVTPWGSTQSFTWGVFRKTA
jgi:SAM-dependent methyltransferase